MPKSFALTLGSAVVLTGLAFLAAAPAARAAERMTPIVRAVQEARPAIVNIHGHKTVPATDDSLAVDQPTRRVNGMGTGVIVDERGYILTNFHVVDGVRQILVTLADKRTLPARLIGHDPQTDLAVIKVNSDQPLPVIKIGTSSDLMQGETVLAVGNAFGYDHTVTNGIISALHRTVQVSDTQKYSDLIQTNADINPGNSGGPLLNINGEMIGINVAVRVGAQGIGFAIPVDEAMEVAARMLSAERVAGVWHGVKGQTVLTAGHAHFVVKSVQPESPAERCGLQAGDVIAQVRQRRVERAVDFERALFECKSGESVEVAIERDGRPLPVQLVLQSSGGARSVDGDEAWQLLGLRLTPMTAGEFRGLNSRYRGGLRVTAVRTDGPAAKQGIRANDILVGMHRWETLTMDNVTYILKHPDVRRSEDPLVFYILRGEETLYGHISLVPTIQR